MIATPSTPEGAALGEADVDHLPSFEPLAPPSVQDLVAQQSVDVDHVPDFDDSKAVEDTDLLGDVPATPEYGALSGLDVPDFESLEAVADYSESTMADEVADTDHVPDFDDSQVEEEVSLNDVPLTPEYGAVCEVDIPDFDSLEAAVVDDYANSSTMVDDLPLPAEPVVDPVPLPAEPVVDPVPLPAEPVVDPVPLPAEPVVDPVPLPAEPVVDAVPIPAEPVVDAVPLPAAPVVANDPVPLPAVPVVANDPVPLPAAEESEVESKTDVRDDVATAMSAAVVEAVQSHAMVEEEEEEVDDDDDDDGEEEKAPKKNPFPSLKYFNTTNEAHKGIMQKATDEERIAIIELSDGLSSCLNTVASSNRIVRDTKQRFYEFTHVASSDDDDSEEGSKAKKKDLRQIMIPAFDTTCVLVEKWAASQPEALTELKDPTVDVINIARSDVYCTPGGLTLPIGKVIHQLRKNYQEHRRPAGTAKRVRHLKKSFPWIKSFVKADQPTLRKVATTARRAKRKAEQKAEKATKKRLRVSSASSGSSVPAPVEVSDIVDEAFEDMDRSVLEAQLAILDNMRASLSAAIASK